MKDENYVPIANSEVVEENDLKTIAKWLNDEDSFTKFNILGVNLDEVTEEKMLEFTSPEVG